MKMKMTIPNTFLYAKCILEAYSCIIMEVNTDNGSTIDGVLKSFNNPLKHVTKNVLYATAQQLLKSFGRLGKRWKIQPMTKGRYSKYFRL